jgi:hypothetical protein
MTLLPVDKRRLWQSLLHGLVLGRRRPHRLKRQAVSTCPPRLERLEDRIVPDATPPFTPTQIRHAYGIDRIPAFNGQTADGTGQTIAIAIPFNDPKILTDLTQFDLNESLPDPPVPTRVFNQNGLEITNAIGLPYPLSLEFGVPGVDPTGRAEGELAIDVEWAHAIAPGAAIDVVETDTIDPSDLLEGITTAAGLGVSVVSMSFGWLESSSDSLTNLLRFDVAGVTFVAASGDSGAFQPSYPAASPNVIAVGGTTLTLNGDGSYNNEIGWTGSGGNLSQFESSPGFQSQTTGSSMRAVPDVAFDADGLGSPCFVYDSYNFPNSPLVGRGNGTSLGTPCWAGLIAIANQGRVAEGGRPFDGLVDPSTGTFEPSPQQALYALYSLPTSDFHDITSGSSTSRAGTFKAGPGYDEVTGLGTPVADRLVPDLAAWGNGSQLAVTVQPPNTVLPGEPFAIVATVENQFGGLDTSFNGQVTIGVASGDPSALGGTLVVPVSNGVANIDDLSLSTVGIGYVLSIQVSQTNSAP